MSSPSKLASPSSSAPAWLAEKVYAPKRQRTITLVTQSVDALRESRQRVSLAAIAATSKRLDPEGRGVSESAILDNDEARTYYEQHRSWQGGRNKRARPITTVYPTTTGSIKPDRDEQRVRQRYLRMSKEALVERLMVVEHTSVLKRERWLAQQDEAFTWRLRAEAAEARLAREAEAAMQERQTHTSHEKNASAHAR